jgi:LysM repeat protein
MRIVLFFLIVFGSITVTAQQQKIVVNKKGAELYIEHKVQPKENWYGVARLYFTNPKEVAQYNGLNMDKGLGIGQLIKIPLNKTNFSQEPGANENGTPVYHVVQAKETLFRLATDFGVSSANIKKWNGLKTDQINSGSSLAIGYLKSNTVAAVPAEKEVNVQPKKVDDVPVKVAKEEKTAVEMGPFSTLYEQQSRDGKQQNLENPVYGVFKSNSGWQDGKYYVLLNNVTPGTIVKIVSNLNRKQLYAKVLGSVPPGKESEGMVMRLSNATLSALGLLEGNLGSIGLSWFN